MKAANPIAPPMTAPMASILPAPLLPVAEVVLLGAVVELVAEVAAADEELETMA